MYQGESCQVQRENSGIKMVTIYLFSWNEVEGESPFPEERTVPWVESSVANTSCHPISHDVLLSTRSFGHYQIVNDNSLAGPISLFGWKRMKQKTHLWWVLAPSDILTRDVSWRWYWPCRTRVSHQSHIGPFLRHRFQRGEDNGLDTGRNRSWSLLKRTITLVSNDDFLPSRDTPWHPWHRAKPVWNGRSRLKNDLPKC